VRHSDVPSQKFLRNDFDMHGKRAVTWMNFAPRKPLEQTIGKSFQRQATPLQVRNRSASDHGERNLGNCTAPDRLHAVVATYIGQNRYAAQQIPPSMPRGSGKAKGRI
jgi:hypothetical protein